jgi:hypothetical protein
MANHAALVFGNHATVFVHDGDDRNVETTSRGITHEY